jgi:hypothetical protein
LGGQGLEEEGSYSYAPPGCIQNGNNKKFYFNTDENGRKSGNYERVCRKSKLYATVWNILAQQTVIMQPQQTSQEYHASIKILLYQSFK